MLKAKEKGMCDGRYIFVCPVHVEAHSETWRRGDAFDDDAQIAYRYLLQVSCIMI